MRVPLICTLLVLCVGACRATALPQKPFGNPQSSFVGELSLSAQQDESWPSLSYLKNDYRASALVAHVLIREAEITGRVGGYENWRVRAEVIKLFKGRFAAGEVLEYFQGAEAGLKKEYFKGDKIVFLLAETDQEQKAIRYSVLENSTLPHTAERARKLRIIQRSYVKRRSRR
jgi:hypothetical protein